MHLCTLNIVSIYRSQSGKVLFFFRHSRTSSLLMSALAAVRCLPPLPHILHPSSACCSTSKLAAQSERQPGRETRYLPANKEMLCTTCFLSISTRRSCQASDKICCPPQTNNGRGMNDKYVYYMLLWPLS